MVPADNMSYLKFDGGGLGVELCTDPKEGVYLRSYAVNNRRGITTSGPSEIKDVREFANAVLRLCDQAETRLHKGVPYRRPRRSSS